MADDYEGSLEDARVQSEHIYQEYDRQMVADLDSWMRSETNELEGYIKAAESEADDLVSELRDRIAELESKT